MEQPSILLGVSGSVAAYRAADLARELKRRGFRVRVCLTRSAEKFVTRELFEALTGEPCLVDVFEEPERGRMAHIDWARQTTLLVVAPATANVMNSLASGLGEDMLTTLALVYDGPILLAPAMNPSMYADPATRASRETLLARGTHLVEPVEGDVACGESGQGKLASIARIADEAEAVARRSNLLNGMRLLLTSGPTREPIDDVRYLSNRSSGKMGAALARAALWMGADVTVVSGPGIEPMPLGATVIRVETAEEMHAAVQGLVASADLFVAAAAVADYRPAERRSGKVRRSGDAWSLDLTPNPDVLGSAVPLMKPGSRAVGFAAEPNSDLDEARAKLRRKGVFALAVNDVSQPGVGFDSSENELTVLFADGSSALIGQGSKLVCALRLLQLVAER